MRAVIQRVSRATVVINNEITASIGNGLVVMLGIAHSDNRRKAESIVHKILELRIFSDSEGKMNLSVQDVNGSILIISNFTVYADSTKGTRPNFSDAAKPIYAMPLYDYFESQLPV